MKEGGCAFFFYCAAACQNTSSLDMSYCLYHAAHSLLFACLFRPAMPSGAVLEILKASVGRKRAPVKTEEGHPLKVMRGCKLFDNAQKGQ